MPLPNFFLLGVAKAGTTSVWHYLRQHPDIFMATNKEPGFLLTPRSRDCGPGDDRRRRRRVTDEAAYRALFDSVTDEAVVGEATLLYFGCEGIAERLKARFPQAKLAVILRQPAERAFSNYAMLRRLGDETETFERALALEADRRAAGWDPLWRYRDLGYYSRWLEAYLTRFDRGQIHVALFDDLVSDPLAFMQDLYRFLGVDAGFEPDVATRLNEKFTPRSRVLHRFLYQDVWLRRAIRPLARALLPPERRHRIWRAIAGRNRRKQARPEGTIERLTADYRDDILALQALIDRDLSDWLGSAS